MSIFTVKANTKLDITIFQVFYLAKYFKCVLLTIPKYRHITASEPSKAFWKKIAWSDRGQNPDVNCTLWWALFFKIHVQWIFTFFKGHVKIFLDSVYFSVTYFLVIIKTIILIQHAKSTKITNDDWQHSCNSWNL